MKDRFVRGLVLLALILGGGILLTKFHFQPLLQQFVQTTASLGKWGPIIFILAYVVCVMLWIPATIFTLGGGAVFGLGKGLIYVFCAANLGALATFLLSRHILRNHVVRKMERHPKLVALEQAVTQEGWRIVLLTRLSPIFPFAFLNYAYGITRVSLADYAIGSFFGMIPALCAYVYLGSLAQAAPTRVHGARYGLYILGGLATLIAAWLITRKARKALDQRLK